ncbi:conserved Plasmodium protein, unknown function [Plasmodium vinckei brucechwatti]|uniref:Uncharacterized protein n=1 Tax=Plasmodium vinckei brucechwatti TaxID=119398 RepID=A0A6V7S1F8_PLAVN|nr:conserved Plasmodium protein, unknown function [Plasmodium vinckei brucechwatti]
MNNLTRKDYHYIHFFKNIKSAFFYNERCISFFQNQCSQVNNKQRNFIYTSEKYIKRNEIIRLKKKEIPGYILSRLVHSDTTHNTTSATEKEQGSEQEVKNTVENSDENNCNHEDILKNQLKEEDENDCDIIADNKIEGDADENEDYEDEDDKYCKSFYEIYDDNKDTYDCPAELLKFIKKENMDIKLKIKCSSPRNITKSQVKNVINNMFIESENENSLDDSNDEKKKEEAKSDNNNTNTNNNQNGSDYDFYYLNSNYKNFNYPDRNVLWPNPLVYNHRLQPFVLKKKKNERDDNFEYDKKNIEINKRRLENLWSYSSSYGIDWNTLDELYLNFKNHKINHLNEWENNKNKIMLYASKVAKRKLIKSRKELLDKLNIDYSNNIYKNYDDTNNDMQDINLEDDQTEYNLLFPRSIFRKWTRTLYFYWKDRYMHYYNNTLCDYLKGEIVDLQLLREHNERNLNLSNKKMLNKHSFSLKQVKGSNLYIQRYIKKKKIKIDDNNDHFDLTGVGENIYNTAEKKN